MKNTTDTIKINLKRKIFVAVIFLLISSILVAGVTFAWFTISTAPEIKDISTVVGANGALEIALNTHSTDDTVFTALTGRVGEMPVYEKNVYWGNIVDMSDSRYGLEKAVLKPVAINFIEPSIVNNDAPFKHAEYGSDGRVKFLDTEKFLVEYDPEGDIFELCESYGTRFSAVNTTPNYNRFDPYAVSIDLLFRSNADNTNLQLRIEATDRIDEASGKGEAPGAGSFLEISNEALRSAVKIAFVDTLTGELYGIAAPDDNGKLYMQGGSVDICPLVQDQVKAITAWIWLDGAAVFNPDAEMDSAAGLTVNLQFSSSATLYPTSSRYVDIEPDPNDGLVYSLSSDGKSYSVVGVDTVSADGKVTIADKRNGLRITSIAPDAFKGNTEITELVIPSTVTSIGSGAFEGCTGITSITLPDGLTEIGDNAFKGCTSLNRSLTIPENVVSIGENAFDGCTGLANVVFIGRKISYIGANAFAGTALINNDELRDDANVLIIGGCVLDANGTTGAYVIPDGINLIADEAFKDCSELAEVTIPESVTAIGTGAFAGTGIYNDASNWDNGVLYIGNNLIKAEETLTGEVDIRPGTVLIADKAFYNCADLTAISLPGSVRYIGRYAFAGSCGPTEVTTSVAAETIGDYAYAGSTGLTEMIISDNIVGIGEHAFDGCTGLSSLTIGSGVEYIGDYAFAGCTGLTEVTVPGNVKSVGAHAFEGCSSIDTLVLENGIETLGDYCFSECSSITEVTVPGSVGIIGAHAFEGCPLTDLEIGDGVGEIGGYAFADIAGLTELVIPDSVTSIGANAFERCTGVTALTIGNGVETIGDYAFYGCTSLAAVTIPDSVVSIGDYAFAGCASLVSVSIGENVESIGENAFYADTALVGITGGGNVNKVGTSAFFGTAYSNDQSNWNGGALYIDNCLVQTDDTIAEDFVITDGTTAIGDGAFFGRSSLKSVSIPSSVTGIGKRSFEGCTSLTAVDIPVGVTEIPDRAFYNCEQLMDVTIPEGVLRIGKYAFYHCFTKLPEDDTHNGQTFAEGELPAEVAHDSLITLDLPLTLKVIDDGAFKECSRTICLGEIKQNRIRNHYYSRGIKTVALPDSVTYIGDGVFRNNSVLRDLTLGSGVEHIGSYAFADCTGMAGDIRIGEDLSDIGDYAFYNCSGLISIEINGSVRVIPDRTFFGCSNLSSVTLPDSVVAIGDSAFYNCYSLHAIDLPESVVSIGAKAFFGCSLYSIDLPDAVSRIRDYAFFGNDLTSVNIEKNVAEIGYLAFGANRYLENITVDGENQIFAEIGDCVIAVKNKELVFGCSSSVIPTDGSVISIGDGAFYGSGITEAVIPDSVVRIGDYAFYDCSSLTSLTIGRHVDQIGDYAFYDCSLLEDFSIPGSVTSIGGYAFYNCTSLTSIEIPDSVTSIGKSVFFGCTSLTSITIPDSVTSIGESLFSGCTSLTSITIPNSVTSIGSSAFSDCTSLTSIEISDSVTSIGWGAFWGCGSLTSIEIPDGVTTIESHTFCGCGSLTSIEIPDSVTLIGYCAFEYCTSLTDVYFVGTEGEWGNIAINNTDYYNRSLLNATKHYLIISKGACGDDLKWILYSEGKLTISGTGDMYDYVSDNNAPWYDDKTSISSIEIGSDVTSIGNYAFYDCTSLTSATIPNSVTSVGDSAFTNCSSLASISIPGSVTSIGSEVFLGCTSLTSVTIPNSVTSIGSGAFSGSSLTSVTIPDSVTFIGSNAFKDCSGLATVSFVNQTRWATYDGSSKIEELNVSDPAANAEKLKVGTSGYGYVWKRR